MSKKFLSICISIAILLTLYSCKSLDKNLYPWKYAENSPANQPIPQKKAEPAIPQQKDTKPKNIIIKDIIFNKPVSEFTFQKNAGIEAMKQNKLSDAIDHFTKALLIKPDNEILKYINECYYERGEFYYSAGNIKAALQDLKKSNTEKSRNLQILIGSKNKVVLQLPENHSIHRTGSITFSWKPIPLADYYIIQIENESWNTVVSTKVEGTTWKVEIELRMDALYYWTVRAHYPNDLWGNWSEKWWFALHTLQYERKQFEASCKPFQYQQLMDTSIDMKGQNITITGKVVEIMMPSRNSLNLLVNITLDGNVYKDTIYVQYTKTITDEGIISKGDIITVWGTYQGLVTYNSILKGPSVLPNVTSQYISIIEKEE